ncbi:hypothetical protein TURU_077953 [Turdus rufiventris]|nr:hypothetical protein TURU_077953 [Turdus rufiventris]
MFESTPPVLEGFKAPLNANDIIQWLVLLIGLSYLTFRDKGELSWITTLIPTPGNRDSAADIDPSPETRNAAPEPDPASEPTSERNHPEWVGVLVKQMSKMSQMMEEYLSPPGEKPCLKGGESSDAAVEPIDVISAQVPAELQGHTQPAAVAPVETRKSKMNTRHLDKEEQRGGPSQPAGEPNVEIITESLSYENLRNLCKDIARRGWEAFTTWLLRVWDLMGTGVHLDGTEAWNLGSLSQDSGVDQIFFLGVKWQDGQRQIPTEVINKITTMSPPTNKKETHAFLGAIGFWRMHIPEYSLIVSPLYLVTRKKNDFHWGPEQQQAFAQIKLEIAHAIALGPVRTGPDVKNVLYSAAGSHGLSWSLWQKVPDETRGRPLGFWSWSYRGSEVNYTPTEKEILADYEGVQAASEVIGTEAQLLLVAQATKGEGRSGQLAELKAVQLALDIAEREKWPKLYLYTDSQMVANALWGWLKRLKKANWQHKGKPIWAADEWKNIATRVEKLPMKVRHVDAHVPKSWANEEHQHNEQVDQASKIEVSQIDWQHKGELFLARWAHDASGHQGRDATYKWARDQRVDLTMDSISQDIHDCDTCAAIKQAKRVKPLWYHGHWSKYKYGEAWQINYITLPETCQGKRYVLTMVEATTR